MFAHAKKGKCIAAILDADTLVYQSLDRKSTIRLESANPNSQKKADCLLNVDETKRVLILCGRKILDTFQQNSVIKLSLKNLNRRWGPTQAEAMTGQNEEMLDRKWGRCQQQAMISVNGIIHKIWATEDDFLVGHEIWNATDKQWESKEVVLDEVTEMMAECLQRNHNVVSVVHVESQNIILVFIGTVDADWQYIYRGIWRYEVATKKWTHIERFGRVFNFAFCDVALTSDEEYVVIVGGRPLSADESNNEIEMDGDRIFVLDIRNENEYKLWNTSIVADKSILNRRWFNQNNWGHRCQITQCAPLRDDLLISGWVRQLFASESFDDMDSPPRVIRQLIGKLNGVEDMVHWILLMNTKSKCNDPSMDAISARHHAMPLKEILRAMSDEIIAPSLEMCSSGSGESETELKTFVELKTFDVPPLSIF